MKLRSSEPERLDLETPSREMMARIVGYLGFVNRRLGGIRAVARHFASVRGPATVLDVGAGAADVPLALAARFPGLRPIALDRSPLALSFAAGLPRVRGDALRLPFADRSIDWVIATHFIHHFPDAGVVAILREFDRVARRGIIVNDVVRSRAALFWIRLLTLGANPYVRADGPQSVRRSFRLEEIESLARRAGIDWLRASPSFPCRFTLWGERPGEPGADSPSTALHTQL
jgi:ubiquinone/menaquinone biosynthesis C-methylase UbiE